MAALLMLRDVSKQEWLPSPDVECSYAVNYIREKRVLCTIQHDT